MNVMLPDVVFITINRHFLFIIVNITQQCSFIIELQVSLIRRLVLVKMNTLIIIIYVSSICPQSASDSR